MKDFYSLPYPQANILQIPARWGTYNNYVYMIVRDHKAWVFDPSEYKPIQKVLESQNLELQEIYITHHHHDHIGGTQELQKKWSCPVYAFEKEQHRIPSTHLFKENDLLDIAGFKSQILFIPGHTLGLIAFYFPEEKWLFSSDLIFSLGCGRVFEGTFEQMQESLKRIRQLPEDVQLMISHEYTLPNLEFGLSLFPNDQKLVSLEDNLKDHLKKKVPTVPTSIGFEKEFNPFLRWDDPFIRKNLNMENKTDWEVFKELRLKKDNF